MDTLQGHAVGCNLWDLADPIDELPPEITDAYLPSEAECEWMRAADLDSFIARGLPFADWIDEKSRQAAILEDDRHGWLSETLARLAQLVRRTGATTPEEYGERMDAYERELREKCYADGYAAAKGGA